MRADREKVRCANAHDSAPDNDDVAGASRLQVLPHVSLPGEDSSSVAVASWVLMSRRGRSTLSKSRHPKVWKWRVEAEAEAG